MEDEKIRQLLKSYTEKEMDLIVPEEMEGFEHTFSRKFERKMKNVMLKEKYFGKNVYFMRPVRRAAMVAAAAFCLLALGNMSADVFNIHPWKYFMVTDNKEGENKETNIADSQSDGMHGSLITGISGSKSADKKGSKSDGTDGSHSAGGNDFHSAEIGGSKLGEIDGSQSDAEVKRTIPAYIPEGMEQEDYQETNLFVGVKWRGKDDSDVSYTRSEIDEDMPTSMDEEYQTKESIVVAGYEGFLYKRDDKMWIDWEDTKYNHFIDSDGIDDENELIKMAESLYE